MKREPDHFCRTCRHAEWQHATKTGRVRPSKRGICFWNPTEPIVVPIVIFPEFVRLTRTVRTPPIWYFGRTECPAWEPKK